MRVLGLIPARGGSKGIPRKNIRPLYGRPLLAWTADAALAARRLTTTVLSTDDPEIAQVGRACGVRVPWLRPSALAADDTPSLDVVQHALAALSDAGETFDAVCLLQPTSPLRGPGEIDACIAQLGASDADAVCTVVRVPDEYHPCWVYYSGAAGVLTLASGASTPPSRRQALAPAYTRDGAVYVTRTEVIVQQRSLYGRTLVGCPKDRGWHANIDTPEDWDRAEALMVQRAATLQREQV